MELIRVSKNKVIPSSRITSITCLPSVSVEEIAESPDDLQKHPSDLVKNNLRSSECLFYVALDTQESMLACSYLEHNNHRNHSIKITQSNFKSLFKITTEDNQYILSYEDINEFGLYFILRAFGYTFEEIVKLFSKEDD